MVRRFHRSIYDELDELRASMDYLYQLALEPADNPLLLEGEVPDVVCPSRHTLDAEIAEHADEVTVTIDLIPGTGNAKISADLVNKNSLKITYSREGETKEGRTGDCQSNQQSFFLHHVIPLPGTVMITGARLSEARCSGYPP